MSEGTEEKAGKYIEAVEKALSELTFSKLSVNIGSKEVQQVVDLARRYLSDAKYFTQTRKISSSLASISYAEGLLDAVKLLGLVEFTW